MCNVYYLQMFFMLICTCNNILGSFTVWVFATNAVTGGAIRDMCFLWYFYAIYYTKEPTKYSIPAWEWNLDWGGERAKS